MQNAFETIFGFLFQIFAWLMFVGGCYWLWMAFQQGSFAMAIVPMLFPPCWLVAAPTGIYSLFYGLPVWVVDMYGFDTYSKVQTAIF